MFNIVGESDHGLSHYDRKENISHNKSQSSVPPQAAAFYAQNLTKVIKPEQAYIIPPRAKKWGSRTNFRT